jgi:proline iminopeptidase
VIPSPPPTAREWQVSANGAALFVREIGAGRPVVVLHGGPDFDHFYLRPELDHLAQACRLIYYDQRGRGRSARGVRPDDVRLESEIADLEALRRSLGLASIAVLAHSWGGLLAMEYATRHPDRVSHLILMNSAPASAPDWQLFRQQSRARRPSGDLERMAAIAASPGYQAGDRCVEAEYYRIHFRPTVRRASDLERIVGRLRAHFTEQGVLDARAIEQRLYEQTCLLPGYDLIPRLSRLRTSTLVLHGEHDLVPVEAVARIADAVPDARLTVIEGSGHFAYVEQPDLVHQHVTALLECR